MELSKPTCTELLREFAPLEVLRIKGKRRGQIKYSNCHNTRFKSSTHKTNKDFKEFRLPNGFIIRSFLSWEGYESGIVQN